MKKSKVECPDHEPNEKRAKAKMNRNKGILAMKKANMDQAEWARKHDPLFQVKGIERHLRLK